MSDQARKKERQRQKRKAKQEMIRKQNALSPYKRLAEGRLVTCLVNEGWQEKGMADVHVLRVGSGGIAGVAVFLVDCWCVGLKDVFGRVGLNQSEYLRNVRQRSQDHGLKLVEIPLEEAARIVAGGIRFAVQNGFRLPPRYERWLPFVGPVDWRNADLSGFGRENGELLWMGNPEDLRRRLISGTVKEFLARPNVKYIMDIDQHDAYVRDDQNIDAAEDDEETDAAEADDALKKLEAWLDGSAWTLAEETRLWCEQNSVKFDPRVDRVVRLLVTSRMLGDRLKNAQNMTPADHMELNTARTKAAAEVTREPLAGAFQLLMRYLEATRRNDDLGIVPADTAANMPVSLPSPQTEPPLPEPPTTP
jgi:hypothetical protein